MQGIGNDFVMVDNLTNSFRPAFTDVALDQSAADLRTSSAFADEFRTAKVLVTGIRRCWRDLQRNAAYQGDEADFILFDVRFGAGFYDALPLRMVSFQMRVDRLLTRRGDFQVAQIYIVFCL